jgi:hypothetical protein
MIFVNKGGKTLLCLALEKNCTNSFWKQSSLLHLSLVRADNRTKEITLGNTFLFTLLHGTMQLV